MRRSCQRRCHSILGHSYKLLGTSEWLVIIILIVEWSCLVDIMPADRGPALQWLYGLKGHESIAQALAWVCISNGSALKGRQKIVFRQRGGNFGAFEAKSDKTGFPGKLSDAFIPSRSDRFKHLIGNRDRNLNLAHHKKITFRDE